MTHTSGPWEYDDELADAGKKSTAIFSEAQGADAELSEPICIIPHDDITEGGYKQVKCNARLIAAAPELLEALEDCEYVLSEMLSAKLLDTAGYGCLEGIRMTISKARGVS